jgi:hypothetical protein
LSITTIILGATVIAVAFTIIAVARTAYRAGASSQKAKDLQASNEAWKKASDDVSKARAAGDRARRDPDLMRDDGFKRPRP